MTSSEKQQGALALISQGLALIPLKPGSKEPAGTWSQGQWDYQRLMDYLASHDDANIGVVAGTASYNLAVIDIDKHDVDGFIFMREFVRANEAPPKTLTVRSGSGGLHLYYLFDDENLPRSSTNSSIGVDIKGEGGYVVAPPSVVSETGPYSFVPGRGPGEVEIARADATVLALVSEIIRRKERRLNSSSAPFDISSLVIRKGERNDSLFRFACRKRAEGRTDREVAAWAMILNSLFCEEPLDERELSQIISQACSYEPGANIELMAAGLPDVGPIDSRKEAHHG